MKGIYSILLLCLVLTGCKGKTEEAPLPAQPEEVAQTSKQEQKYAGGAEIYNNFCVSCHLSNGEGMEGVFPPLKNSNWLKEKRSQSIHAVKYGLSGRIEVNGIAYDNLMPSPGLTDQEVADVMNYINSSWGNVLNHPFTEEEVAAIAK
jgi:mono/diheme cytochrome c family protein